MATIPRFPNIPEVESGQMLGATYLNSLAQGCEYLLGISHASHALPHATAISERYENTWGDMAAFQMYHAGHTVFYVFWAGSTSAGKTWHIRLQYYSASAWHTAGEWSGTEEWVLKTGTLDLSASGLSIGTIYSWKFQGETDTTNYYTQLQVWLLSTRPTISGWTSPPTISAGASSPTPLNTWRSNLAILNSQMVSRTNVVACGREGIEQNHTAGTWQEYERWAYRYRPNGLTVGVQGKMLVATWDWRVRFTDTANQSAIIYTSPHITTTDDYVYYSADIDLTSGDAAAALAAAGITLAFGSVYSVSIETKRNSDDHAIYLRYPVCVRISDGIAGGSWTNNKLWAHKDRDVGPTQLNKIRTDMLELYNGAEQLWGESYACYDWGSLPGAVIHLKRYLIYEVYGDNNPGILYGSNFSREYGLLKEAGWQSFDLSTVGVPWGGVYIVTNPAHAFEMDEAY